MFEAGNGHGQEAGLGLYVHIPFCTRKCHYCDFASGPGTVSEVDDYLDLLGREARERHPGVPPETVFVGGGTPSVLLPGQIETLFLDALGDLDLAHAVEITSEANPESMNQDRAAAMVRCGVTRVSLGAQSFDDDELNYLGRPHRSTTIDEAVGVLRRSGISNVNLDLILGFPGHREGSLRRSLDRALRLEPTHISTYMFTLEEDSFWGRAGLEEQPDSDLQADLYELTDDLLQREGFVHYEISNWARPGFECRHNMKYWTGAPYLGLGVSASSYRDGARFTNPRDVKAYRETLGSPPAEVQRLAGDARLTEELMLRLRLSEGVPRLPEGLSPPTLLRVERLMERHLASGLVRRRGEEGYALTRRGYLLSNLVFEELI